MKIVRTESENPINVGIRPDGFWTEVVNINKVKTFIRPDGKFVIGWKPAEISWSSGGQDGTVDSITATKNFIEALQKAIEIAKDMDSRRPA